MRIAGGWGYDNVGDEVILAGYLDYLTSRGVVPSVLSADPQRTTAMQAPGLLVTAEKTQHAAVDDLLVCGGGYLNGSWRREVGFKLDRLCTARRGVRTVVHGVEVRGLAGGRYSRQARELLHQAEVAVRDTESAAEVRRLGVANPTILPDAISLLFPTIRRHVREIPELHGRVIVNLLDIGRRPDSSEAEFEADSWLPFCIELLERLGSRAVAFVGGAGDYRFLRKLPPVPFITPASVADFVSVLDSAEAVFSVRMHPGLVASMLAKPTVSVPYCGKVRPTLERLGLDGLLLPALDVGGTLAALTQPSVAEVVWADAYALNSAWLDRKLSLPPVGHVLEPVE